MSDILSRGFRAQLTTAMDSISRRAVFEIMKIFENTLYDNQMELLQKGEEVAQLKIKLQRAELKLKDLEEGTGRQVETNKAQTNPLQTDLEVAMETPGQTSEIPEIDFEVPDDWCAPLGCEMVTRPDEGVCPSVRLRPLSIPLWHIPVPKNEVLHPDIDQRKKGARRSSRIANLNERTKPSKDKKLPARDQSVQCQPLRNNVKLLLHDIKEEYPNLIMPDRLRRRPNLAGRKQENTVKCKIDQRKSVATKSTSKEQETVEDGSRNVYSCKICKKMFNTEFGRSVHERSHKKCRGCKKIFLFPSTLKAHKPHCKKLKKLLAREAANTAQTPFDKEETCAPNEKRPVNKKSTPSKNNGHQAHKNAGRYSCTFCSKTFDFRFKFIAHMRIHTGEKPYSCSICTKTFRIAQSLQVHMVRRHNKQNGDINRDLSWTKPLEELEENRDGLVSPSKRMSLEIKQNKRKRHSERSSRWQTMGVRYKYGFMCLSCNKVLSSKAILIEHYRIHTGERPLKCDRCPASFRYSTQLCKHKKWCR